MCPREVQYRQCSEPFEAAVIEALEDTVFPVSIGPSGADRGYEAITGQVGWLTTSITPWYLSWWYRETRSTCSLRLFSLVDNCVREFEVWCPAMTVIAYWGSQQDRSQMRYEILSNRDNFDVILTTYNVCIGQAEDRKFFRKLSLDCLVLDEGHMLKNMNSLRYTHTS
ncbi:SWI/SNF-related matrix-associated actin-dependent regulator of chromatin subfamily A containing DEAD/H box 1-like isoform X1 [Halichondria panicea]|uniref:SWI/SNF-related matrix-associated actin-dependent regulator of chromatin subfamily A containing DEAD/H box 1-like isoform X1 n=1 Tax=Halichondria panicea TaxID=6063 RepID=UPI00312BB965